MKKTDLADQLGISTRTLQRRIVRLLPEHLQVSPLTDEAISILLSEATEQPPVADPTPKPEVTPQPQPEKKKPGYIQEFLNRSKIKAQPVQPQPTQSNPLFSGERNIAAAATLIITDATCCAWIAVNSFEGKYTYFATFIFFLAGMAIGYSAIKNTAEYTGRDSNAWLWGFAIFQFLLHTCALEVIGQYSFIAGKIVMSVGGAMATAGLALTFKKTGQ